MCDCNDKINEKLAEHNTQLSVAFSFGGGTNLIIATEVKEKKRGARPTLVFPTFCPFCGSALRETDNGQD